MKMKHPRTCNRCWGLEETMEGFRCQFHYLMKTVYHQHCNEATPCGPCPKPITGREWLACCKERSEA